MIATGGLLRINARRQDSLRSKPHKAHTHKRKSKKKRRSEVVVVKGKLKLCSLSGLVAALGVLVLLVGVVMAALGYWPRDGLFFSTRPQEGAAMASVSSSSPTPAAQMDGEEAEGAEGPEGGADEGFNHTEIFNGTQQLARGFLEDFLDRYLYSDRLKVLGPLIMGIGIFLFICANAVLHENRDKKTKVINLRDIYSTVIDLHSLRKPNASSGSAPRSLANPLNGLINYVQSKSLEAKPRAYPASLLGRREPVNSREGGGEGGDGVFSVYQQKQEAPPPSSSSHRLSLPQSCSPSPLQEEALGSAPQRRHSAWAGTGRRWGGGGEDLRREGRGDGQEEEERGEAPLPVCASTPPPRRCLQASCSSSSLHRGAPGRFSSSSLTPSHLSLSSLSHLLSSSSPTLVPPCRRRSLPTAGAVAGYSKLQGEDLITGGDITGELLQQGQAEDDLTAGLWAGGGGLRTNQRLTTQL
uniref:Transmembrane protein 200C n=1 Tax=Amphiprion percula TaxID=161767 RepID=A0A3P8RMS2_AMPPE